ncbi:MAG: hypothetical protein GX591_08940, partial [Planctomycetes bacterium]|nr:hypothetical protein [Planctomycetota bacterium]
LSGNRRLSSVAGFLMGWDDQTQDHDRYALGQLTAGDVVELTARTPTGSTAAPMVYLYDANWNLVADEDGVPWDDHVQATIPATGVYYVWINTWEVYQGHGYLFHMANQTVHDAAATAATYGGYLVSLNSQAEWDWLTTVSTLRDGFDGHSYWIGLSDAAEEGVWRWADGTLLSEGDIATWYPGEPNYAAADYVRGYRVEGWLDETGTQNYYSLIESDAFAGRADGGAGPEARYVLDVAVTDDVPPRVVSTTRLPSDGQTTSLLLADWTLTVDEALDAASVAMEHITLTETGSGAAVPLTVAYDGDRLLTFTVDGAWRPLQSGLYRLSVDGLTDVMGNALDGDADGTGGDPYVRAFTVVLPSDVIVETTGNESITTATEVPWIDGGLVGYWSSQAYGSLSPTGDVDYWKVWLDEGDGLTAYVESPYSSMSMRPDLYNAAGGRVLDGYDPIHDGRYEDSVFYGYRAPASDWYYVAISRYDGVSDEYRLHLTRTDAAIAQETDDNHSNYSTPDVLAYALSGNRRLSSVAGFLMGWDDQTQDHDRYALGQLTAGDVVELTA